MCRARDRVPPARSVPAEHAHRRARRARGAGRRMGRGFFPRGLPRAIRRRPADRQRRGRSARSCAISGATTPCWRARSPTRSSRSCAPRPRRRSGSAFSAHRASSRAASCSGAMTGSSRRSRMRAHDPKNMYSTRSGWLGCQRSCATNDGRIRDDRFRRRAPRLLRPLHCPLRHHCDGRERPLHPARSRPGAPDRRGHLRQGSRRAGARLQQGSIDAAVAPAASEGRCRSRLGGDLLGRGARRDRRRHAAHRGGARAAGGRVQPVVALHHRDRRLRRRSSAA